MNDKKKILFVCGDRSADIYLSLLLKNLNWLNNNIEKIVFAGEVSKPFSNQFVEDLVSYDAHGFFSPFLLFFKFYNILRKIKNILKKKIDLVILIDYYGFNIRVAKEAKKLNIPVIYYIAPQVWATREKRIRKIKKYVDYVINIYPFEVGIYEKYNIKSKFFGHPLLDILDFDGKLELDKSMIGIFPGSRKQVIKWNLPVMLKVAKYYYENFDKSKKFIIFGFERYKNIYQNIINSQGFDLNISIDYDKRYRKAISFSISVSGTVVLENVLYGVPSLVIYNLPLTMYLVIRSMIKVKYISLPNIILDKVVVPEFIKGNINIRQIAGFINEVLSDNAKYDDLQNNFKEIKSVLLGNSQEKVSKRVAEFILRFIYERN